MNNVVVTVLYLSRALHRRIIVYRIIVKNPKIERCIKASLSTAIYGNKMIDCLLSRSQRLICCVRRRVVTRHTTKIRCCTHFRMYTHRMWSRHCVHVASRYFAVILPTRFARKSRLLLQILFIIICVGVRYYLRFDSCNRYGTYPIGAVAFGFLYRFIIDIEIRLVSVTFKVKSRFRHAL